MPSWGISLCCFSRFLSGSLKVHSRSWSHRGALVRLCVHLRFLREGNSVPTKAWRVLRQPTPAPRKNRHGECWTPTGRTLSRHCCQGKQRASRNTKASIGSVPSFVLPLSFSLFCDKMDKAFVASEISFQDVSCIIKSSFDNPVGCFIIGAVSSAHYANVTSFPFRSNGFLLGRPSSVAAYPRTIEA